MKRKIDYPLLLITLFFVVFSGCSKKEFTLPEVSTNEISEISLTTAISGGQIESDGGTTIVECGICYHTSTNPTVNQSKIKGVISNDHSFTCRLTDLAPNTTYFVKAYAINSVGTVYGSEVSFTTSNYQLPVVVTKEMKDITQTTSNASGNIISDGGTKITSCGVCWGLKPDPITEDSTIKGNSDNGSFTCTLSGLLPNTTYYLRAFATNIAGTGYGNSISFITQPEIVVEKEYQVFVDFEPGEALSPSDRPNIYVIWMENNDASFIQNMFICKKLIAGGLTGTALPYWKVNRYPLSLDDEVDAVTSATIANQNFTVSATLKDKSIKKFRVNFEIDHSFDENDWFSDQPSLLYSADINLNDSIVELRPIGWTPNENTENQVSNAFMGKLQPEMRYITHKRDGATFGVVDTRSSTKMVKSIKVRIQ